MVIACFMVSVWFLSARFAQNIHELIIVQVVDLGTVQYKLANLHGAFALVAVSVRLSTSE